ncbi:MMPL family transporter [Cellulomonas sp. P22]|uniref:MMPL family transporter n=1 Tax=Cellulomonas sp. P22 TaxID=3373189 RepID=UPI003789F934
MAELLYRLGRLSARRAWVVVAAWAVVVALAAAGFAVGQGTLTSAVSIPGTATAQVTDALAEKFPQASGGAGTVVFQTADGSPFTQEQRDAIAGVLTDVADLDGVSATIDPFASQAELDGQTQQVAGAQQQLADGQAQIDEGRQQLEAGQEQLDAARAQAEQAGMLAQVSPTLDAQQAQIDAQLSVLEQGQAELDAQRVALEQGAELVDMASALRTVSEDGSTALATVQFDASLMEVPAEVKEEVGQVLSDASVDGVEVALSSEISQSIPTIGGVGELVGVVIAAVTLFVMLGTLIGAGLPLLNALVGVGVGVMGALAFSGTVDMLSVTPILGVMLGLAVGIDYSLFILNRHRNQLRDGVELHESIGLANGTSGNAVVFAGSTVLIALLALNISGIPFLGLMGTVAAVCVAVAILVAITLTPALLAIIGPRILPRRTRSTARTAPARVPMKPMSTVRAVLTLVAGVVVLAVVALPALSMRLGLPDGSAEPVESSQYQAFKIVEKQFGAGLNGPLLVVAELPAAIAEDDLLAEQVAVGQQLMAVDDVRAVAPIGASQDATMLAFQVIPDEGPTSESTEQLVRDLRDLSPLAGDVELGVAGNASGNIDISEKLAGVLPLYLAVVVGLSLIIMIFVFRSILVPVTATLGFVLSLFAAFGGITAIFQWGWLSSVFGVHDPGPILSFLPILLVGILFGLAMDYQLFLVSGMRESYAHGVPARLAVRRGLHAGRTVVVAAAIIMISVFAGFVFADSAMIKSIGFGLAFGVLLDAFVVRLLLIPAVMHLLGDAAWWLPAWLDRILPNVDVEGAALERTHPHPTHPVDEAEPARA